MNRDRNARTLGASVLSVMTKWTDDIDVYVVQLPDSGLRVTGCDPVRVLNLASDLYQRINQ